MSVTAFVWVFNGERRFPGGVFSTLEAAESWIRLHRLSGIVTAYPLDEGCWDWALRTGRHSLSEARLRQKQADAAWIGGFSTAYQEHYHYEDGRCDEQAEEELGERGDRRPPRTAAAG